MTRSEELKYHYEKLGILKDSLTKAHQEFKAHEAVFMTWLAKECGIDKDQKEPALLTEILMKWSQY